MSNLKWNTLSRLEQLDEIDTISHNQPVVLFKHSTRCSISTASLNRLERKWDETKTKGAIPYFLDLIAYRSLSTEIAQHYGVDHQSPQVLVIINGRSVYDSSHLGISFDDLVENINVVST